MNKKNKLKCIDKFNLSTYVDKYELLDVVRTDRTYYTVRCKSCGEISSRRFERIGMCSLQSPCTVSKRVNSFKQTCKASGIHQSEYWQSTRRKIAKDYYKNEDPGVLEERNKRRKESLKEWHAGKQTHNFKQTKDEDYVQGLLESKFKNVKSNWKTDKYPYYCDFYIEDIDTYIELNLGVFHGFSKFRGTSKQLKTLQVYKDKNTPFWDRVIYIWTESDIEKRNTAYKNKLTYYEFYTIEEFEEWFTLQ